MHILVIEASTHAGELAVATEKELLETVRLPADRRHARDLVPALGRLMARHGWKGSEIDLVLVDSGPGSYTGLRVGIMVAKSFCYASGAFLVDVEAGRILADAVGSGSGEIHTIIDAQQGKIYWTPFGPKDEEKGAVALRPTEVRLVTEWAGSLSPGDVVTGPALARYRQLVPAGCIVIDESAWLPSARSLWRLGLADYQAGCRSDFWTLEPQYLRASSAEIRSTLPRP